jgi:hypothetical protein
VVDATGIARSVVATREPSDSNQDLWWAHTGGGGGNFGIVTRYWFRSPGVAGSDPATLLPAAPASVLTFNAAWNWRDVDEPAFTRLVRNFGAWCERHSAPDDPATALYSTLALGCRQQGTLDLSGLVIAGAAADRLLDAHLAAINDGVDVPSTYTTARKSWLAFALDPAPGLAGVHVEQAIFKLKDALLRMRGVHTHARVHQPDGLVYDAAEPGAGPSPRAVAEPVAQMPGVAAAIPQLQLRDAQRPAYV